MAGAEARLVGLGEIFALFLVTLGPFKLMGPFAAQTLHPELMRLKYGAEVEVRIIAVPDDWVPPVAGTFQRDVMNALADLGEKMGADPFSWRNAPPE